MLRRFGVVNNCRYRGGRQSQERFARRRQRRDWQRVHKTPSHGVHKHPAAAPRARVRRQQVLVEAAPHPDRRRAPTLRKAGENLVPEPARQAQEGRSRRRRRSRRIVLFRDRQLPPLSAAQRATCRLTAATCVRLSVACVRSQKMRSADLTQTQYSPIRSVRLAKLENAAVLRTCGTEVSPLRRRQVPIFQRKSGKEKQ